MKHYKLITTDPSPSVIGVRNGIYQVDFKDKDLNKNDNIDEINELLSTFKVSSQQRIKNLRIDYLEGTVLKSAKITDIMVVCPYFFGYKYLISNKVRQILENNVVAEEYHVRKVFLKPENYDYYFLFVPQIPEEEISFSNSVLIDDRDFLLNNNNTIQVGTAEEYRNLFRKKPLISYKSVCLNRKYSNNSIISIEGIPDYFFSEELTEKFEEYKITNFRIPQRQVDLIFI